MIGAHVTHLQNLVHRSTDAFPFGVATVNGDPLGMWDSADPSKLAIPKTGWWWIGADITTLGTFYGGPSNQKVILTVVKNWDGTEPHLDASIAAERFWNENGIGAHLNSMLQLVYLAAGDYLQLLIEGSTSTLLVESNPPIGAIGSAGTGAMSPHFYAVLND